MPRPAVEVTRFVSAQLSGFAALGPASEIEPAFLEFEPRVTVLVGRNGAGKSAILNSLSEALSAATGIISPAAILPANWAVDLRLSMSDGTTCAYKFATSLARYYEDPAVASEGEAQRHLFRQVWSEAFRTDPRVAKSVWLQNGGTVHIGKQMHRVSPRLGFLVTAPQRGPHTRFVRALRKAFAGVESIAPGAPSAGLRRQHQMLDLDAPIHGGEGPTAETRLTTLMRRVVEWHLGTEEDRERLAELNAIARRIGLVRKKLEVRVFGGKRSPRVAFLTLDSIPFTEISDGTQRMIEILAALVASARNGMVLIEEPETGVHPGMLSRLLSEVDAYSHAKQIVLTTHSPDTLNAFDAPALRIVRRIKGRVHVERVANNHLVKLRRFLRHEGTVADYVFGGALGEGEDE